MQPRPADISIDDSVLADRCRRGDSSAMERLVLRYQNRIYNIIFRMCANPDDAAELTQDTFVKVIENIGQFQGRSSFYTWIFRIAVNLTVNYCKRRTKTRAVPLDSAEDENGEARGYLKHFLKSDAAADPAVVAQNKELCGIVARSLKKLDESQRAVLILRDIEGMDYAQIAEVLGTELGTVKSRLSRARNSLLGIMESFLR